jgi:hypothetical protein
MHVLASRVEAESEELNCLLTLGELQPALDHRRGSGATSIALTTG